MTLQISGQISSSQVRTELTASGQMNLGSTNARALAQKPSGTVKLSDFYSRTYVPPFGETWTSQVSSHTNIITAIVWTGSRYVATGGGGKCVTSPDGNTWTNQPAYTTLLSTSCNGEALAWNGTTLLAGGNNGYKAITSTDGVTWTNQPHWVTVMGSTRAVAVAVWADTLWVACSYKLCGTSPDGITWTNNSSFTASFPATPLCLSYNGTILLASAAGKHAYSLDLGVTWTASTPIFETFSVQSICWTGTKFVAVGYAQRCATSPDGITWTENSGLQADLGSVTSTQCYDVSWNGTQLVACGTAAAGKMATSTDGITWVKNTTVPDFQYYGVCLDGPKDIVLVGASGKIITSP